MAKSAADRKRAERERDKALGVTEIRMKMSSTERDWVEQAATLRGYQDKAEYLIDGARHDLAKAGIVTDHRSVKAIKVAGGEPCEHQWEIITALGQSPRVRWCQLCGCLSKTFFEPSPHTTEQQPAAFNR